jgi:hypothetical protein
MSGWSHLPAGLKRLIFVSVPDQLNDVLRQIARRNRDADGGPSPSVPEPTPMLRGIVLRDALDGASVASPEAVESVALGALEAGRRSRDVLAWAKGESDDIDTRAAAVTAVLRRHGYEPAFRWAEGGDEDAVRTLPAPPGVDPDLFAVPRRIAVLGSGIRRRFATEFPETAPALSALMPASDADLFRPEVIPALAREEALLATLGEASDDRFEKVILPLSRVLGANVLILAGLLVNELSDPMEVLDWIGADITALPRRGVPNRPETIVRLDAPGRGVPEVPETVAPGGGVPHRPETGPTLDASAKRPRRYMIFSDIHREPEIDAEFRIDHFARNRDLYLRALDWCYDRGYTVIENGDCEELWFEPTFDPARRLSKRDRLERIVSAHQPVYKRLQKLAKDGRYRRSIGNHDSYLWEDAEVRAWRETNDFPPIEGGFVIPGVKTFDDFWPHVGLDPKKYSQRQALLAVHGHQYDFWNCDEHNRLGKFIANAVGVLVDALDDVIYDYRGVDMGGHPLIEFWDVLAPITPFDNWPPREIARTWAETIEQREPTANLTQDSIMFSETFVALMAMLMRSGPRFPDDWHVLICLGHTHNPHSRPWIPYLSRLNPLRSVEIFGLRPFENFIWPKTHYLNSGTVGWWENLIWAIEITEEGQPRLVYWSGEDREPVTMDWELHDQEREVPPSPLPGLVRWAREHLPEAPASALAELATTLHAAEATTEPEPMARIRQMVADGVAPDVGTVAELLAAPTSSNGWFDRAEDALGRLGVLDDPLRLATAVLAGRGEPELRGTDPRSLPRRLATGRSPFGGPGVAPMLWPRLLTGAQGEASPEELDAEEIVRALDDVARALPREPEITGP